MRFHSDRKITDSGSRRCCLRIVLLLAVLVCAAAPRLARAQAVRTNPGFRAASIPRNDDGSTSSAINLGFTVNFFGATFGSAYVNNNGNITFGGPLATFTPQGLKASPLRIIAPFWADVDTRAANSALVTYGNDTVNGRPAFGANYVNVGYYASHDDKLNSFQLVLIDRSDINPGDFDIEFNYDRILWETGDASGGRGGLGGTSASAGYSNGTQTADSSFEILGSRINNIFLDSNRNGLRRRTLNSGVRGRLVFFVRSGNVGCTYATLSLEEIFPWEGGTGTVQVGAPSGCGWTATSNSRFITITSPADGNGSGANDVTFTVAPNRSTCPRSGTITVAGDTITVTQEPHVTLKVTPPALQITPLGGSFPTHLSLQIDAVHDKVTWFASAAPHSGSTWKIALTPNAGTATELVPSVVQLDLTSSFQPTFGEIGTITVRDTTDNSAIVVPIILLPDGRLMLSHAGLTFRAFEGGPPPPPQTIQAANSGQGSLNWSVGGGLPPWLSLSSMSGAAASGATSPTSISVNPAGLTAGLYQALIPVSAGGTATQLMTVSLQVVPANTAAAPMLSPSGLVFVAQQGGTPAPQSLSISNVGAGDLTSQLGAGTFSGGNWLSLSSTSATAPGATQVLVNSGNLSPGFYRGQVHADFSNGPGQGVQVLLVVTPSPRSTLNGITQCSPQVMDVVPLSTGTGASAPLYFSAPVLARVIDNCGGGVNNATVFLNIGDTANTRITLQAIGGGLYSGVWTPQEVGSDIPMKVVALHPSFGKVENRLTMSVDSPPGDLVLPGIAQDGVSEAAGCAVQQALALGSIINVAGAQLAASDAYSAGMPLDQQLNGASIQIGNETAPLFSVSSSQIQAQVPFSAQPWSTVPIVVNSNGILSTPQNYLIAPVQPAVFDANGVAAAVDSQNRAITADNPAHIGQTLRIFANGLGAVDPAVPSGAAAPASSTVTNRLNVSIGGVEVPVVYQGLAAGYVGLYEIRVVLTSSVPTGDAVPIIIRQAGITSNPAAAEVIPIRP
jgi:uncharacterized protein (TIGR03437 family)